MVMRFRSTFSLSVCMMFSRRFDMSRCWRALLFETPRSCNDAIVNMPSRTRLEEEESDSATLIINWASDSSMMGANICDLVLLTISC